MAKKLQKPVIFALFLLGLGWGWIHAEIKLRIYMEDGTLEAGNLVADKQSSFVLLTKSGRVEIPKKKIMFINGKTLEQWQASPDKLFQTEIIPSDIPTPAFVNDKAALPQLGKKVPVIKPVAPLRVKRKKKNLPRYVKPVSKPEKVKKAKQVVVKTPKPALVKKVKTVKKFKPRTKKRTRRVRRPRRFDRVRLAEFHYKLALKNQDLGLTGRTIQELHKTVVLNRGHLKGVFLLAELYKENGVFGRSRKLLENPLLKDKKKINGMIGEMGNIEKTNKRKRMVLYSCASASFFLSIPLIYGYRKIRRPAKKPIVITAKTLEVPAPEALEPEKEAPVEEDIQGKIMEEMLEEISSRVEVPKPELVPVSKSEEKAAAVIDEVLGISKNLNEPKKEVPPPVPVEEAPEPEPVAQVKKTNLLDYDPDEYLSIGLAVTKAVQQGNELTMESDFTGAIRKYRTAMALNPRSLVATLGMGYVSFVQNQWDLALDYYKGALFIDPNSPDGHYGVGRALVELERVDEAVPELRRALELDPSLLEASQTLSELGKAA